MALANTLRSETKRSKNELRKYSPKDVQGCLWALNTKWAADVAASTMENAHGAQN